MRYVSLACDATLGAPVHGVYAAYAPVVMRLWQRLGYRPIVFKHEATFDSEFGRFVSEKMLEAVEPELVPIIVPIPRCEPLSVGNTMRVARLAAASNALVQPHELVLMADIDMAPISRTWFERDHWLGGPFVLRGDMHGSFAGCASLNPDGTASLLGGHFRFPMCYAGATKAQWFDMLPLINGQEIVSIRRLLHSLRHDCVDYDEQQLSSRFLHSRYAVGPLCTDVVANNSGAERVYKQGDLTLLAATDWPTGVPEGMMIHGGARSDSRPNRVDWHMPRPAPPWLVQVMSRFWSEESKFLEEYWPKICELTKVFD